MLFLCSSLTIIYNLLQLITQYLTMMKEEDKLYHLADNCSNVEKQFGHIVDNNVLCVTFEWFKLSISKLCSMLKEWKLQKILLSMNEVPNALEFLTPISFPVLRVLCISNHQIQSIQNLCQLNAPSLEYLSLYGNIIVCIKSLSKCRLPQLKMLNLTQNKIVETDVLNRAHLPNIQCIDIEISLQLRQLTQSMNWIAKLPQSAQKISVACYKRMEMRSLVKAMGRRKLTVWDSTQQLDFLYST